MYPSSPVFLQGLVKVVLIFSCIFFTSHVHRPCGMCLSLSITAQRTVRYLRTIYCSGTNCSFFSLMQFHDNNLFSIFIKQFKRRTYCTIFSGMLVLLKISFISGKCVIMRFSASNLSINSVLSFWGFACLLMFCFCCYLMCGVVFVCLFVF